MNLTIDNILNSKIYVKDNSGIQFQSPKFYLEPFLQVVDSLSPSFNIEVSGKIINRNEDMSSNESYSRVKVEAKLPDEYSILEHDSVIGIVYALDTAKPVMKIYSGRNAWACTNLAIFNANHLFSVDLMQGTGPVYDRAKTYVNHIGSHIQEFKDRVNKMKETEYNGQDELDECVGALIRKGMQNKVVGTTAIMSGVQSLYDKNSVYSVKDDKTSQWNIYSSITQYFTDKTDLLDRATKTLVLSQFFETLKLN